MKFSCAIFAVTLFVSCRIYAIEAVETVSYESRFDPWRANNYALKPAAKGDADAQTAFFLSTYVRLSQPYAGGEDLEQMTANVRELLKALGDVAFAKAIQSLRPEVRSSVRWFVEMKSVRASSPKTYKVLNAAPKIDWPTDQAIREN